MGVSDIQNAARAAHAAGAILAVDSTCATPVFTRPIALGADVVMHSATKYLNGPPTFWRARSASRGTTRFPRGRGRFASRTG
jgi:O-acetylhomoserine/O-acetylserine sulfhydrylase-like pyridoxal-dependent enzyme